jgi:Calx-beta domain/FG-GAP-like repeat
MRLRSLVKTLTLVFAVFILASMSFGQTFPGTGVGAIPDATACGPTPGTPLNITFNVTGVAGNVSNLSVDTTFGTPNHTWMGDIVATLIAPNATQFTVFGVTTGTTATAIGDSSDLGGLYTFNNAATGNWWDAAALAGAAVVVPPGAYRTAALGGAGATNAPTDINAAFATTPANGTWTLRITDGCTGDTGAITAANLTFSNAGPVLPNLVISDVAVTEGNAGTTAANFTVTLSGPAAAATNVLVNFATADASATAPSDYTATAGTLTFLPGELTKTVTVLVNGDTTFEPGETFQVNLTAPSPNATIADNQGIGTINNDDASPAPACIFNNGGLNPQTTAQVGTVAPAGSFWSELQADTGVTTEANGSAGFSAQAGTFRLADNFTVPAGGCQLNTVSFFAYQTGSAATPSPFATTTLQIWNGRPGDAGAAVVFGDTTTNRLASSVDTTFFRLFNSAVPNTVNVPGVTRKIWRNTVTVGATLAAGTYWLDWSSAATNAAAHFYPAKTIPGARGAVGDNARSFTVATSVWADSADAGAPATAPDIVQDIPFFLNTLVSNDAPVDFNGDGKTDFAVVRNIGAGTSGATNQLRWFYNLSGTPGIVARDFGIATDRFVAEDFDGDGRDDITIWRPGAATVAAFFILRSTDNTVQVSTFGQTGDDPSVVGDYDGDNKADVAVYRTGAQSTWFYRGSLNNPAGNITFVPFGATGDFPAPGDYDGDGRNDFVIQRPAAVAASQSNFWLRQTTAGNAVVPFGLGTDVIIPGDYDGDGKTDIATARGAAGAIQWQWQPSSGGAIQFRTFGASATDSIVQGDYDGDGKTEIAVWRPATGTFWTLATSNGAVSAFALGATGDASVATFNTH